MTHEKPIVCPQCGRNHFREYCNGCGHRIEEPICPALRSHHERGGSLDIAACQRCKLERLKGAKLDAPPIELTPERAGHGKHVAREGG